MYKVVLRERYNMGTQVEMVCICGQHYVVDTEQPVTNLGGLAHGTGVGLFSCICPNPKCLSRFVDDFEVLQTTPNKMQRMTQETMWGQGDVIHVVLN